MDEGLTNPGHYSMPLGKNGKKCFRICHCKKKSCRLMDATRRAGVQWHPGNRKEVGFNGHDR